ncbi:ATP-binding protein [Sphingomonas aerolata]|uniref:ATP-binding protein n=1 Tax=Sphingomonas aerolata TaxID=185951 RepID=UPI00141B1BA8|nr:two-component system sensor kinase FixL [Sphingomonas aerolata]
MQRLWAIVDQQETASDWRWNLLQGVGFGSAALVATAVGRHLFGIDLPFTFALAAIAIGAVLGGALTACVGAATTIPTALVFSAHHPLVTPLNTLVVTGFAIILALFGGRMTLLRQRAGLAQGRSHQRELCLHSIFNTTPAAMLIVDAAGDVLAINRSARGILGIADPDTGRLRLADLLPGLPDLSGDTATAHELCRADGTRLALSLSSGPLPFAATGLRTLHLRDETEQVAAAERLALLQAELHQLARATALGQLGSAIAHELNQPLATAANFATVAQAALARGRDVGEVGAALDGAVQEIFRAAAVLKRLRRFVERGPLQAQWVDARDIIAEGATLGMLAVRQAGAELKVSIAPDLGELWIDAIQIQQVLLNLIANAADAVSDTATRVIDLRAVSGPDGQCTITVSDTGPGIAPGQEQAIFAPFRTSKPHGLGVGLAICRAIVDAHEGTITAATNSNGGATFRVALPQRPGIGSRGEMVAHAA